VAGDLHLIRAGIADKYEALAAAKYAARRAGENED